MGTGPGWTNEERVALCKAYLTISQDPVKGEEQSGPTFWTAVVAAWNGLLAGRPGVRWRTERGVGGVQKQWDMIHKGVNKFGSHYLAVKRMELTENPSEENMISAAMARFCDANVYEAMRKDRAADMAKGKKTKRKAKQVHCPWVPCVASQNVDQVIGGREASRTCPLRTCTAIGPSDPGSQAARGDDTRHSLLAGDDGASHRRRPSS